AELNFIRGVAFVKKREYEKAFEAFQAAIHADPEEGEYYAHLGWVRYMLHGLPEAEGAIAEIEKGLRMNPFLEYAHLFLGKIFKARGDVSRARHHFELALQCNPDCAEAISELTQLAEMGGDAPDRLPPETVAFVRQVNDLVENLDEMNHFELLGVSPEASEEEIRRAYFKRVKVFHADRLPPGLPEEIREKAESLFTAMTEAYDVLGNPRRRRLYERSIFPREEEPFDDAARARRSFESGRRFLKSRRFGKAIEAFREATRLDPENATYEAYLGYALSLDEGQPWEARCKRAIEHLEAARARDDTLDKTYLFLGDIHKRNQALDTAEGYYREALARNPRCYRASHELKQIELLRAHPHATLKDLMNRK
ncbi:MAG: hypothetical protein D6795_07820, partial [Deltaproteobacteria bacterium]